MQLTFGVPRPVTVCINALCVNVRGGRGREEGREEGRKGGREGGREEGREGGRKEGRDDLKDVNLRD